MSYAGGDPDGYMTMPEVSSFIHGAEQDTDDIAAHLEEDLHGHRSGMFARST